MLTIVFLHVWISVSTKKDHIVDDINIGLYKWQHLSMWCAWCTQGSSSVSCHPCIVVFLRQWASYQIFKTAGCACAGNAGNVFSRHRLQRKPLVSDPGMHHGTCVTHVPWCLPGSLTRGDRENIPGITSACATIRLTYLARGPYCYHFS